MKTLKKLFAIIFLGLIVITTSCDKDDDDDDDTTYNLDPKVETLSASDVTSNSAKVKGSADYNNGLPIIERGFFLDTEKPAWESGEEIYEGPGSGDFTTLFNNLTPNTKYYFCAFASTSDGLFYGESLSFTTESTGNIDLNGKWETPGGFGVLISGDIGTIYSYNSGWQAVADAGLVSIGDIVFKDISYISSNTWNFLDRWLYSTGGVPQVLFWADYATITLSEDGSSIFIYSEASYNGLYGTETYTMYRQTSSKSNEKQSEFYFTEEINKIDHY